MVAVVIANGYIGIVVSLMTKPTVPEFPASMKELVKNWTEYKIGLFKDVSELHLLASVFDYNDRHKMGIRLHLLPWVETNRNFSKFRNHLATTFSHNFAIIVNHLTPDVKELIKGVFEGEKLLVDIGITEEIPLNEIPLVSSTFMNKLIQPIFKATEESGLYKKWKESYSFGRRITQKQHMRRILGKSSAEFLTFAPVLFNLEKGSEEPKPGGMNLLKLPSTVYSLIYGLACIVLQLELLFAGTSLTTRCKGKGIIIRNTFVYFMFKVLNTISILWMYCVRVLISSWKCTLTLLDTIKAVFVFRT